MRRLLPALTAVLGVALGVLLGAPAARAEEPDAPSCALVEHERSEAQGAAQACQEARDHLCAATSAAVEDVLRDRAPDVTRTGCVSPGQQERLGNLLRGWSNARSALGQLTAYADGETDRIAAPQGGASPLDRLVQRMTTGDLRTPLAYRRLLVEAIRLVAPASWRHVRERGPGAIDAWFLGREPLDAGFVAEAQRVSRGAVGPAGPPLSAALRLVLAYELVARCTAADAAGGACPRAHELQQVLESTGPLIVKRRIQDIWATECAAGSPATVLAWVTDFPGAQASGRATGYDEVTDAAYTRLYSCFLGNVAAGGSFGPWLETALPGPADLTGEQLARLDEIRSHRHDQEREDACAHAVRVLERMPTPSSCKAPVGPDRAALESWAGTAGSLPPEPGDTVRVCREYARLLWEGYPATLSGPFARPPSSEDMVRVDARRPETSVARLRALCAARVGPPDPVSESLRTLGSIARGFGESTASSPWRLDPQTGAPVEEPLFERARRTGPWLEHLLARGSACNALNLSDARCTECAALPAEAAYDCAEVRRLGAAWQRRTNVVEGCALLAGLAGALASWARRLRVARREFATWARECVRHLADLDCTARRDPVRHLLPSRYDVLVARPPRDAAWERWGTRLVVVRAPHGPRLAGRDIDRAAQLTCRAGASVGILVHDDDVTPDLSAVRAVLEWAARGGTRAVQIVAVSEARLNWTKSARDVLDLFEETTLRGDPFDLRGRIASSSQFFNRERLVSGLLAAAQGGRWQLITGLRRFGKSSLALEVARRLPGPTAYVDLAAFHHEIGSMGDPSGAADTILRYVCLRLTESATSRYGAEGLPAAFAATDRIDATALAGWFAALSRVCRAGASERQPPVLVVLDEIEQALAVGPERIRHALDVLAITVGRLRGALGDDAERTTPVAVFLCSAPHSLLWAPLGALAGQSIMGSFPSVCVPRLTEEAAGVMMKSLGLRQGVRFSDDALEQMIAAAHGIPLLLRRIGSSALELYDLERARHGGLGTVSVGPQGASEAIAREVREGSPVRVWVESEICDRNAPAGAVLRALAREDRVDLPALRSIAERRIAHDFAATGLDRTLEPEETARRVEEAAGVLLRLLSETGLLVPVGDLTAPEAYALPDGVLRRVLGVPAATVLDPRKTGTGRW